MIKAVLFDYGGVLSPGGGAGSIHRLFADLFGLDVNNQRVGDLHRKLRRGAISDEDFFAEANRIRQPGLPPVTPQMFLDHADIFERSRAVYKLAEQLRTHGIQTGILSNIYGIAARALRERGFYDGFDPVVLSCDEHLSKPDPEFYHIAIRTLGVQPSEILFIDDQQKCMPPAQALGMHVALAVSPQQIVHDAKAVLHRQNNLDL